MLAMLLYDGYELYVGSWYACSAH